MSILVKNAWLLSSCPSVPPGKEKKERRGWGGKAGPLALLYPFKKRGEKALLDTRLKKEIKTSTSYY